MDFSLPALPPNVTPLTDGDPTQVGRYRLIGRLGADGMSTLFAAVSPDHEAIALKIAAAEWASGADRGGEFTLMRQAGGVCAVGARDSDTHEGRPWSAIGYVPGFGLRQHVRMRGRSGGNELLVLAAGVAEALATVHGTGAVHGDVRPGNVVAAADGPKVLDFGITRRIDGAAAVQSAKSLGWLAPERYDGAAASEATDVHGWACLVVFAATGEPPFGTSPAGHTPGRIPGQILWEMARRAREARVDLSGLPEELRPLLVRAFSPDPAARPSAEEAYLECLLMLGIDEQATADTWPDQLRALIAEHWPDPDLSWHDPARWTAAALALSEGRQVAGSGAGSGPGAGSDSEADGSGAAGAAGVAGASGAPGESATAEAAAADGEPGTPGEPGVAGGSGQEPAGAASGPGPGSGESLGYADTEEEWGPEEAVEAYGHVPRGEPSVVPGMRSAGTAGQGGGAAAYLFGPSNTGGHDLTATEAEEIEEDDDGGSRVKRLGVWLGVGALGMAAALGGGYLLFDALSESPADTVSDESTQEPAAGADEDDEDEEPEEVPAPEALACDDADRVGAQEEQAHWRPFDPEAASVDVYLSLLTPVAEGESVVDSEIWPFAIPVDHDTVDFGLATPSLHAFPVVSVCMTGAEATAEGTEFTVEVDYHPNVGSHHVYAEDFLTLLPLDPDTNGGADKEVLRGGNGDELGAPLSTLAVLSPENPSEELTVLVPGSPDRAGVAYRPAAHSEALVHDLSGHCYDVDGTLEWRGEDEMGSGFFALPGAAGENDMSDCPSDELEGTAGAEGDVGAEGDAGADEGAGAEGNGGP